MSYAPNNYYTKKSSRGNFNFTTVRTERQVQLLAFISSLQLANDNDCPIWSVDGISQKTFTCKAAWNVIRPHPPTCDNNIALCPE